MNIGFTGTRNGMTKDQLERFGILIHESLGDYAKDGLTLYHGMCKGADEQAHYNFMLCLNWGAIGFPSNIPDTQMNRYSIDLSWMGPNSWDGFIKIHTPQDPLERNKLIVEHCDVLIAAPKSRQEERRSGTWATIRYARKLKKPIYIIWP